MEWRALRTTVESGIFLLSYDGAIERIAATCDFVIDEQEQASEIQVGSTLRNIDGCMPSP